MKGNVHPIRFCPKCGQGYTLPPALSREDNETLICPDCGIRESLEFIGLPAEEQEKILNIIHENTPETRS